MNMHHFFRFMEEEFDNLTAPVLQPNFGRSIERELDGMSRNLRHRYGQPFPNFPTRNGTVCPFEGQLIEPPQHFFAPTAYRSNENRRIVPYALHGSRETRNPPRATQRRIERSTLRFKYEKVQRNAEEHEAQTDECTICCNDFEENEDVRRLPCLHIFHVNCIDRWLKSHQNCPICRISINGHVDPNSTHITESLPPPNIPNALFSSVHTRFL